MTAPISTSVSSGTGVLKTTIGGGSAGVTGTATSTSVASGGFESSISRASIHARLPSRRTVPVT